MSSNESSVIGGGLLTIAMILVPIWIGYETYQWIDPKGFWGIIKFLFAWSIFGTIADAVVMVVVGGLLSILNNNR